MSEVDVIEEHCWDIVKNVIYKAAETFGFMLYGRVDTSTNYTYNVQFVCMHPMRFSCYSIMFHVYPGNGYMNDGDNEERKQFLINKCIEAIRSWIAEDAKEKRNAS